MLVAALPLPRSVSPALRSPRDMSARPLAAALLLLNAPCLAAAPTLLVDTARRALSETQQLAATEPMLPVGLGMLIFAVLVGLLLGSCCFGSDPAAARREKLKEQIPGRLRRAESRAVGQPTGEEPPPPLTEMSAITPGSLRDVTITAAADASLAGLPGRESMEVEVESTPLRPVSSGSVSTYQTPLTAGGGGHDEPEPDLVSVSTSRVLSLNVVTPLVSPRSLTGTG
jgi:hypothetical protein